MKETSRKKLAEEPAHNYLAISYEVRGVEREKKMSSQVRSYLLPHFETANKI
jgi:hypothetical protein